METEEAPVDVAAELAAFDEIPEFDPISELELPEDFDLSLSLDDESPAAKSFASSSTTSTPSWTSFPRALSRLRSSRISPPKMPPVSLIRWMTDFDFFSGADEVATKLDLARAYIDMGDHQGARDILDEVVKDGDDNQRQEAEEMLSRLV